MSLYQVFTNNLYVQITTLLLMQNILQLQNFEIQVTALVINHLFTSVLFSLAVLKYKYSTAVQSLNVFYDIKVKIHSFHSDVFIFIEILQIM